MIPKIIHYIWLSNDKKPDHIIKCMETWTKRLPDYKVKCWSMNEFDVNSVPYVKEAVQAHKWAFAADYIRLYALYTEGGFYLDSDVVIKKSFDDFLNLSFVTGIEYHENEFLKSSNNLDRKGNRLGSDSNIMGLGIQAAIMGSEKNNKLIKECLDYYQNKHFINADGSLNNKIIAPCIYAQCAEKFGFQYKNETQKLTDNMIIYKSDIFAGGFTERTKESYAIHFAEGSWRKKNLIQRIRQNLVNNDFVRKIFRKETLY